MDFTQGLEDMLAVVDRVLDVAARLAAEDAALLHELCRMVLVRVGNVLDSVPAPPPSPGEGAEALRSPATAQSLPAAA